jgi:Glycosyltransferase
LIKNFSNIINKINNVVLVIVGRGELESEIKNQVQRLGLSDSVFFLGVRNDVHNLLSAMDIFLLPSLNEGFPVILVETQANGLNAIVSAKVTEEIKITDLIKFITLDEALWENEILKDINACNNRENMLP